jgi:tetratricopeptide (TPR) repeat protein
MFSYKSKKENCMSRIKLPGKEKHKKILLIILVIMAIGVLFYEHNRNIKDMERKLQQEMDKASNGKENNNNSSKDNKSDIVITGDSSINNEIKNNKEIKDAIKEENQNKGLTKEKKNYSNKENELYNQAYALFFSKDYKGAIDKANGLVDEFYENPMGYNIRGIARAYKGDYEGGMADIDKSLQIDESYGYARFNKALTYELYGNMENALKWYNKDLEVEEYVWTYYGISSIYGRRGDIDNTMKYLNKAIEMDAGVKEVAKEEEDFNPVKDFEAFKKAVY